MKLSGLTGFTAAVLLALGAGSMSAQVKGYTIEGAHSEADFAIKHLGISTVHGSFHKVSGTVLFDPANIDKSSVTASIDVTSVDTGEPARDTHLKSPDFFDTAKFPTMTFQSTSVVRAGDHYDVKGQLTMHGVTKPIVLRLDPPTKELMGMDKKPHRGFTATTVLNRRDFGLVWGGNTAAGDAVLGDDIKIELDIDAVQQ